jgi:hypothetical protein
VDWADSRGCSPSSDRERGDRDVVRKGGRPRVDSMTWRIRPRRHQQRTGLQVTLDLPEQLSETDFEGVGNPSDGL